MLSTRAPRALGAIGPDPFNGFGRLFDVEWRLPQACEERGSGLLDPLRMPTAMC